MHELLHIGSGVFFADENVRRPKFSLAPRSHETTCRLCRTSAGGEAPGIPSSVADRNGTADHHHVVAPISQRVDGDARRRDHPPVLHGEPCLPVGEHLGHRRQVQPPAVLGRHREEDVEFEAVVPPRDEPPHGRDGVELDGVAAGPDGGLGDVLPVAVVAEPAGAGRG